MTNLERKELSLKQSKEYEKIYGVSYSQLEKELNLKYPIYFTKATEKNYQ